jgi:hypothetical protein
VARRAAPIASPTSFRDLVGTAPGGRILTALPVLFLIFDASIKLGPIQAVSDAHARLGFPDVLAGMIGVLELACLTLYLVPATAVLGAVLLTAFLGGAVAIHLRIGDPLASHTLFPVYVGALFWAGLFLRDARLRDSRSNAALTRKCPRKERDDEILQKRAARL